MSLKVQVLAVCWESGPVTVSRLFERVKAWHMLSCNTTVFIELLWRWVLLQPSTGVSRYRASVSSHETLACPLSSFDLKPFVSTLLWWEMNSSNKAVVLISDSAVFLINSTRKVVNCSYFLPYSCYWPLIPQQTMLLHIQILKEIRSLYSTRLDFEEPKFFLILGLLILEEML